MIPKIILCLVITFVAVNLLHSADAAEVESASDKENMLEEGEDGDKVKDNTSSNSNPRQHEDDDDDNNNSKKKDAFPENLKDFARQFWDSANVAMTYNYKDENKNEVKNSIHVTFLLPPVNYTDVNLEAKLSATAERLESKIAEISNRTKVLETEENNYRTRESLIYNHLKLYEEQINSKMNQLEKDLMELKAAVDESFRKFFESRKLANSEEEKISTAEATIVNQN
jgi:TRAP-type mannitol/chloroaromatic compound transport system substrate-binding protein